MVGANHLLHMQWQQPNRDMVFSFSFSFFFYTMSPLEKKKKEEMEKKKEKEKTMSPLFCYVNSGEQLHC
jgi:hypothetical protein